MTRLHRLSAPAVAFSAIGLLLAIIEPYSWSELRGGLIVTGLYTLALQLAVAILAVVAIDELSAPARWSDQAREPGPHSAWRISTRPTGFTRALLDFYRYVPLPVFLLAFGLGISVSAVVIGTSAGQQTYLLPHSQLTVHGSELALSALWLIGTLALVALGGAGALFGYVAGFGVAAIVGQVVFEPTTVFTETLLAWTGGAIAIWLVGWLLVMLRDARRRSP